LLFRGKGVAFQWFSLLVSGRVLYKFWLLGIPKRIVASGCQEYLHHSAVFHGPSLSDLVSLPFYVEGLSIFISVAVTRPQSTKCLLTMMGLG